MYNKDYASFQSDIKSTVVNSPWNTFVMKIKLLNSPLFGLAILILLSGVIGALVCTQIDRVYYTRSMVMHTYEVISTIDSISQTAVDAESGTRGYLLSGKEEYLIPLHTAVTNDATKQGLVYDQINHLKNLIADNADQKPEIILVENLVTEKMNYMNEIAKIVHDQSKEAALVFAKNQKGRILMDGIKLHLKKMRETEEKLLKIRIEKDKETSHLVIYTILGLLIALVGIISAAFITIHQEFRRRQIAEKNLEENMLFQDTILKNSLYIIIACYPNGIIRSFNKSAEKLLGYKAEELIGKHTAEIFHDKGEMISHANELSMEFNKPIKDNYEVFVKKSVENGSEEREWTYIAKDGTRIPVLLSVTILRDDKGKITGYVGIAKDISERKHIDKLKDEFISTVSHELRTPLTSIRGSLGLVVNHMEDQLTEKTSHLIRIAYKNTERLTRLINDILDIEKIESGNVVLNKHPLPVSAALHQSAEELHGFADQYQVDLVINDQTNGGGVLADPDRLQQILDNLISNAIKFSPQGGRVLLSAYSTVDNIIFSVQDNGDGIPYKFQDKIFGKFAQADSSASRKKGGTGLGLSICRSLVEAMDGEISFESVPGKTEFFVSLPIAELASKIDMLNLANSQNQHILICEDDPDVAKLLEIILVKENFICHFARSAEEAKLLLDKQKFAAMTLDLNLPGQHGISFLKELRADPKFIQLPIIVISAHAEEEKKALNGEAISVIDWLTKPIDIERLKNLLHSLPTDAPHPVILHIEDDFDFVQMLSISLQENAILVPATSLKEARYLLTQRHFDLAVVDIKLPDGNGLDLLPELSMRSIPVIILSVHETPEQIKNQVNKSMIKSIISEDKIIQTIKSLITQR